MSTSDSDYSIDWLASDEDDYGSPTRLSPQHAEELPVPPSSNLIHYSYKLHPLCSGAAGQELSEGSKHHYTRKRVHSAHVEGLCEKTQTDTENEQFSQKCTELQCYIQSLSDILQGLRSGRYSERFSSFQESVAMDRIQRIMGVLQNPNMGGRFLSIVLKIAEMLHSWFPHIRPDPTHTEPCTPAKTQKQHQSSAPPPPPSPVSFCSSDSSTRLKWLHMSPMCSLKTLESTLSQPTPASPPPPPACCSQGATQDSAVSSSTDSLSAPPSWGGALPAKFTTPCLVRLLQAKDSIITPQRAEDGGSGS
ncbi:hypothetical protein KUCAC02_002552 [Chaenocephalus aceratus]|uniref:Uncharacterized protein n=1 Tax=Chaenocephalus aceratus TaxID=36190 RepID=A0ACB9XTX3_CHAAC|nr:hypothetical protein KUCAC02_002552 [Chaenocephalus aceratus]